MKLRRRINDVHEYELQMYRYIGGLIVRYIDDSERSHDIIIDYKTNDLQRITKLHPYIIRFFFLWRRLTHSKSKYM